MSSASPLHAPLLAWYDANRRRLPWRESPSPYRTWVSEIMLQQTQVATVIPYFERFLARFPDPASLAAAPEAEVLRHWAGLGYYSRARNLHAAARAVRDVHGGELPGDAAGLRELKGIGRYTAAAIGSIAFGRPEPLVDGNVERVFARLFALRGRAKSAALGARAWELAERHLHRKRPGDWNQALMELGALVCLPGPESPRCGGCPLASLCLARRRGLEGRLPPAASARKPVALRWTALRIEDNGRILLWKRAADERFLPGHWALPEARHLPGVKPGALLRTVSHSITHHKIALSVRLTEPPAGAHPQTRWFSMKDARHRLISSLWRKALR